MGGCPVLVWNAGLEGQDFSRLGHDSLNFVNPPDFIVAGSSHEPFHHSFPERKTTLGSTCWLFNDYREKNTVPGSPPGRQQALGSSVRGAGCGGRPRGLLVPSSEDERGSWGKLRKGKCLHARNGG